MSELASEIIRRNWRTITYRELHGILMEGRCPSSDTIIVSVDDLGTAWLRPTFVEMVAEFTSHGLVLVVGVIVNEPQSEEIWQSLREFDAAGIEVASHTVTHLNLETTTEENRYAEMTISYRQICNKLGRCPVSLILPFGEGGESVLLTAKEAGYQFVVGIAKGKQIEGGFPYLVGRIPPDNDSQSATISMLENSFP